MINTELKKAIIDYIFEIKDTRNRHNNVIATFKRYIYDENWNYLIWWKEISDWIDEINKLI